MPAIAKGQKTISSFFAARASAISKPSDVQRVQPQSSHVELVSPPPRALQDNPSDPTGVSRDQLEYEQFDGDESWSLGGKRDFSHFSSTANPEPKRRKVSLDPEREVLQEAYQSANSPTPRLDRRPTTTTDRTARYLFCATPSDERKQDEQEGEDPKELERIRREKLQLHQRFVKKLGRPDSIAELKRRNHLIEDHAAGEAEDPEDEDEPEVEPVIKSKRPSTAKKAGQKLTPMEQQVVDIKREHLDTLIIVEVGYKFRFFGEDARIAARELSIVCIPGKMRFDDHPSEAHLNRFASASIPTHRLHVHVKRLVAAGHKVGVVRQLETAALKAVGDNRNTPFVRELTNLYTKGTYIDDVESLESTSDKFAAASPSSGYLLCLAETSASWASDEKVRIGLIAVQPSTGDVIYDDFEDGFMRSEVETRLLHIAPCEFVLIGNLSKATEKLVQHLSGSKANVFGDKVRVERVSRQKTAAADASKHISSFYESKLKEAIAVDRAAILGKVKGLSELTTICLSAMIEHMAQYGLEHVFDLTKNFHAFSSRSNMLLNGNTLGSLEIYRNQTDNTEHGTLFWVLDRTITRFGQRLLKKWIGRPLLIRDQLEERINAVEELKDTGRAILVDKLRTTLNKTKTDLERSLIRIYYGKCTRPELLSVLQTLQGISSDYALIKDPADAGFKSSLLNDSLAALPRILQPVISFLDRINAVAAKGDDKYNFFTEDSQTDAIAIHKCGIADVKAELDSHRTVAAEKLKKKTVEYVTVAGIDFLIEVRNTDVKGVPASWMKISGTKAVSRFHTPEVVRLIKERDQHTESLAVAADAAFTDLLGDISAHYSLLRDAVSSLATLDALLSLASVASQPGYCKPSFIDEQHDSLEGPHIEIVGGRHPMVEQHLLNPYVPNDMSLTPTNRAILLTGPNMGGKSSYVRSIALLCIMAQIGSYVPADSARLRLLDAVFTRMGARDNMLKGESTFMVELGETSEILKVASRRSLVILDELGRGTSTFDGVSIAMAVLDWAVKDIGCGVLFVTHYQSLARMADVLVELGANEGGVRPLRNMHMKFATSRRDDSRSDVDQTSGLMTNRMPSAEYSEPDEEITFLFEATPGIAHRSYGLNVARLANVPSDVIQVARTKSAEMEAEMKRAQVKGVISLLTKKVADVNWLDELIPAIEGL